MSQAARKKRPCPAHDWNETAQHSFPDLENMPGHLWRAGHGTLVVPSAPLSTLYPGGVIGRLPRDPKKSARVKPEQFKFCNYQPLGNDLYPPAEDESDLLTHMLRTLEHC